MTHRVSMVMAMATASSVRVSRELRSRPGELVRRLRRVALVAALVALVPALVSFTSMALSTSNTSLSVRSVEWLRDNGLVGLVAQVENWYYSLTAPSKGGPTLKSLPNVGHGGPVVTRLSAVRAGLRPARVRPFIWPWLAGEGAWHPTRAGLGKRPPLLVTTIRDEPAYPRVVLGLAWINTKRTHIVLYPGRLEPAVTLPTRGPMEVPPAARSNLLATFNSGFKLSDSLGGYTVYGHTYAPMVNGLATFVGYRNGRVDILDWHYGKQAPAGISYARQNLPLIVENGKPNPALSTTSSWGVTVGNAILVWRSGIGIDRHGNLIYAAGNDQTVISLAHALIRAGAVRAMELDINSYWVSFITYGGWNAFAPSNLLPDMNRPVTRYLTPDDRDFFAVYLRRGAG
jgi:hypothetical protein